MVTNIYWQMFRARLEGLEHALKQKSFPDIDISDWPQVTSPGTRGLPYGALSLDQIDHLLSDSNLSPPHGLEILNCPPELAELPNMPEVPSSDSGSRYSNLLVKYEKLNEKLQSMRHARAEQMAKGRKRAEELGRACLSGSDEAILLLLRTVMLRHALPQALVLPFEFAIDRDAKVVLCTIEVPDFSRLRILKAPASMLSAKWRTVAGINHRKACETVLYALCIRAAYLTAKSDPNSSFDTVAVNALQRWHDPATGTPRKGIVASIQASKATLQFLQPGHLDPKACFRHFRGICVPNVIEAVPVRPIFTLDTNDRRVIQSRDVVESLAEESNLAAMPWDDFEHLVRQLFEWMFSQEGVEVKVTRASHDRGVDAIVFDPDPIRGGKFVIQAKRYTRTVDVASVRDLYGTVVNEGANRGILVTTSAYGPDSYEFAKDKPISLVDGPNLLNLLAQHGRRYRIDLEEARGAERTELG